MPGARQLDKSGTRLLVVSPRSSAWLSTSLIVNQVAELVSCQVRLVMRGNGVGDFTREAPDLGQDLSGIGMCVAENLSLGIDQRQVVAIVQLNGLQVVCWAGDIHQQLADIVQQAAGKGDLGVQSGALGEKIARRSRHRANGSTAHVYRIPNRDCRIDD